ncbi:peptidyl-tRNA hydrolase domain-containing protein [Astrocystis sublimbata]|nr:peptidyl-tRNA hydrolase domain-containing protein [Astrocystis sublimbata]
MRPKSPTKLEMPPNLVFIRSRIPPVPFMVFPLVQLRTFRSQADTVIPDQDDLHEAWKWHDSFNESSLPKGQTSFSRSSGPGGQKVNKTESKATTVWSIEELYKVVPKLMRDALRLSRYYTKGTDSIKMHAQTHRDRNHNTSENRRKLFQELLQIYKEKVPGPTSERAIKKHEDM